MSYDYRAQRPNVFTEDGQVMFLKIRDRANQLLAEAGAFRSAEVMRTCSGDTWDMLACIDRLVEIREIREITGDNVFGQHRVFVRN